MSFRFANYYWPTPKSFSVGQFTDLRLYYHALSIGINIGKLTVDSLNRHLPEKVVGISFIQAFRPRTSEDLLRELDLLDYLFKPIGMNYSVVSGEGRKLVETYQRSYEEYLLVITEKLCKKFIVPGWFVNRLWELNPEGQGQITIPAPIQDWQPNTRKPKTIEWDNELAEVTEKTIDKINSIVPNSFPVDSQTWMKAVEEEYNRLSKRSKFLENYSDLKKSPMFSQRLRLTTCMRTITVKQLFGNVNLRGRPDFDGRRRPLNPRTFQIWCNRLESMEFLFYTDYYNEIPGRLIFPTSVFREDYPDNQLFKELNFVKNRYSNQSFYLYQPNWDAYRMEFVKTLYSFYQYLYNRYRTIYVPLQQLRDELCRSLRISARRFELLLESAYRESVERKINYAISLETDVPNNQRNQMLRRQVLIFGRSRFLIAIKPL